MEPKKRTASCEIMRSPLLRPAIAMPVRVCTCTVQFTSARPRRTPPCSVKPGRLTPARSSRSSSMLTLTRFEAVTSVLVPLHQELSLFPGNAHGAVVVNAIIPAVVRDQAIDRGQVHSALPFRGGLGGCWAGCGMDVHGEAPHRASETTDA